MVRRVQRILLPLAGALVLLITAVFVPGCGKQQEDAAAELAKSPDYIAAMGYFDNNQLDSAIVYFEKITKELPGNPDGWAWYADVARRMSKMDEADAAGKKKLSASIRTMRSQIPFWATCTSLSFPDGKRPITTPHGCTS